MVSASLALKISQIVSLAFGIGLSFFPQALMETYKGNTFNGASAVMLKFVAGIAGSNMLAFSSGCGVLARDGVVAAAQSVACLSVGITWIAFAANDSYLATTGQFGDSVPVESVYANSVLFLILGAIALLGWKEAGSHLPAFDSLMPKGKPQLPLLVSSLNLVFFAVGCTFFTEAFLEMYAPGVLATLPGATRTNAKGKPYTADAATTVIPPILLFLGNAGKVMIANLCATFAACSVGDVDVSYRYLRVHCFSWVFFFGMLAREGVLLEATGWPSPMRTATVVQCFATIFFMRNELVKMTPKYKEK